MRTFDHAMAAGGILLLDGGLSTQLESAGADLDHPLWTARTLVEDPSAIRDAHLAYLDAGADVLITASYQVSAEGFASLGSDAGEADLALRTSVTVARQAIDAAGRDALVAASVGPYGAIVSDGSEFRGDSGLTHEQLVEFHRRRIDVLAESAPDLLAIETIPSIGEAEALVEILDALPGVQSWISFTCADAATLPDGSSFADAVSSVAGSRGVVAVGLNCTAPTYLAELVSTARRHTAKPIVAYPNRGGVWDAVAKRWHGSGDEELSRLAPSWADAGARLIGGCCGTAAPDIRDIGMALADRRISL